MVLGEAGETQIHTKKSSVRNAALYISAHAQASSSEWDALHTSIAVKIVEQIRFISRRVKWRPLTLRSRIGPSIRRLTAIQGPHREDSCTSSYLVTYFVNF